MNKTHESKEKTPTYEEQLEQFLQKVEAKIREEAKKMSQEELEKRMRNTIRLMQDSAKELRKARKYKAKIEKIGEKWSNILLKYEQKKEMEDVIGNMQESLWVLSNVESICDRYYKTYRTHHKVYREIIDKNKGETA